MTIENKIHRASAADFKKIPSSPIAYWASAAIFKLFEKDKISNLVETRLGMATADNNKFLRLWYEVSSNSIAYNCSSRNEAIESALKWFPYQKGGEFRKWHGNLEYCVNWQNDGFEIQNFKNPETGKVRSHNYNLEYIFKDGVTWNALTSSKTSARFSSHSLFDNAGSSLFGKTEHMLAIMSYMNSNVILHTLPLISPTLNFQPGDISKLPIDITEIIARKVSQENTPTLIEYAKSDWNSYETSWDFQSLPLIAQDYRTTTLAETYQKLRQHWQEQTLEMQRLEEENNRIFIDAYGLADELTPEVPLSEITLTCNPHYRYGGNNTPDQLEAKLQSDTIQEFIHYAVGCMFGRYSLDKQGLVLANQGDGIDEYKQQVPNPTFMPDEDNVITVLDDNWFADDIVERFQIFLRTTFGEDNYKQNLEFVEQSIGKDIRKYFLKDFYDYHVRRYKKRPIYWMFSSPKGTFNALIYMHRYRADTVSIVLNYLRDFRSKLEASKANYELSQVSANSSDKDKIKATKEIEKIKIMLDELNHWEKDILHPLATNRIEIDLDDGVKVNYAKFGTALKEIKGLKADDSE